MREYALLAPDVRTDADRRLVQRLGSLVVLLVTELLVVSTWLDTDALQTGRGLTALLAAWGPGAVRFVVAAALLVLVFGESSATNRRTPLFASLPRDGVGWPSFYAHLGLIFLFAVLSWLLFGTRLPGTLDNVAVLSWIATGVAAVVLAAVALVPARCWTQWFMAMRPVLAFAFAVSLAAYGFGWLASSFWLPSSRATLTVASLMLRPFMAGGVADPSTLIIGGRDFQVMVSRECSGYEGLGLILVFTGAWLWFHRAEWRFPHAFALIPFGLTAIWFINCARIAALVLIGNSGAPGIAQGGFHSQAGWLGFNVVALGTCLLARRVPWLTRTDTAPAVNRRPNPTAVYLIPFLAILASSMVSQLASSGFEWLYPLRVAAAAAALWYFRRIYRTFTFRIGWASLGLGVLAFAMWMCLEPLASTGPDIGMPLALTQASGTARTIWLTFRLLGAIITVPIVEELAFRGFLLRRFVSGDFQSVRWQSVSWTAVMLSSLAFGVLHGERWLAGAICGVIYAVAVRRRGSIGDAVVAHATTNALVAGWVLSGGRWQLW